MFWHENHPGWLSTTGTSRAGYVMRREDNRWTKRVTEWQPKLGRRNRGWQKCRWRDDITTGIGATWTWPGLHRTEGSEKVMKRPTSSSGRIQAGKKVRRLDLYRANTPCQVSQQWSYNFCSFFLIQSTQKSDHRNTNVCMIESRIKKLLKTPRRKTQIQWHIFYRLTSSCKSYILYNDQPFCITLFLLSTFIVKFFVPPCQVSQQWSYNFCSFFLIQSTAI